MTVLRSFVMALSCFSRIPVPNIEWKPESMRYMMCFFPFIGICIGLACWLWCWIADMLHFGNILLAAGITLIPVAVTGGIHLDGLADCIDAQASHAEPERKREILKDPHSGAFAIIGISSYMILYFALASEFQAGWQTILLMGCMFVASRCMSAVATIAFSTSDGSRMLASFHSSASKKTSFAVLVLLFIACAALMIWTHALIACIMLACALICLALCHLFAKTQFGGMSGDIAGAFLQVTELLLFACLVIGWKVLVA